MSITTDELLNCTAADFSEISLYRMNVFMILNCLRDNVYLCNLREDLK